SSSLPASWRRWKRRLHWRMRADGDDPQFQHPPSRPQLAAGFMIRPAEHWAAGDLKAYPRNKLHTHLLLEAAAARGLSVQEPGGLLRRFFDHSRSCYLTGRRFASV